MALQLHPLRWLKLAATEPLVHFLVLGAAVFGADHIVNAQRGDLRTISVSKAVTDEARAVFTTGMKRPPSAADLKVLTDRWIDNEVLYREGLALGLDRGDSAIRDRIVFKTLSVTQSGIALPKIDPAGLRAWFEQNRARYDRPARFDFLEAVVDGDKAPHTLQVFASALNGQGPSATESGLRVFKDRPRSNLIESYGEAFATGLEKLPPGEWHTLPGRDGLRVVRLEALKPGENALFEDIQATVYQDWRDDTLARLSTQAVREMGKKYQVRFESVAP